MLSLDLVGVFNNILMDYLLHSLRSRGILEWLVTMVISFIQERHTKIIYARYQGDQIYTIIGILQGSLLLPILFLFFILDLLDQFQKPKDRLVGIGFIDNTNLVIQRVSIVDNYHRLTIVYIIYKTQLGMNRAKFTLDKYQLIYFIRYKRHTHKDLILLIQVGDHQVIPQKGAIQVLGVQLDLILTQKEHIVQATRKGLVALEALGHIAISTQGPLVR